MSVINYKDQIRKSLRYALKKDQKVFIIGVGVTSPNAIFGTLSGLHEEFPGRVIEAPLAEAMLTGLVLGAALTGMKPILVHQRINFAFLGMDQIINHIAVWHDMFPDEPPLPIMIRGVVGQEGWGNGAQHLGSYIHLLEKINMNMAAVHEAYQALTFIDEWLNDPTPTFFIDFKAMYDDLYDTDLMIPIPDPLPSVTQFLKYPMQSVDPMTSRHEAWIQGYQYGKGNK